MDIWKWYQNCLSCHPVKTQVLSSGILWGFGDVAAQFITHSSSLRLLLPHKPQKDEDEKFKINWTRVVNNGLFGFCFVGPVGHFWYEGLDKFIRSRFLLKPTSVRFVATKVAADSLIYGPLNLLAFFTYIGFANGKKAGEVKEDLKRDFLPALILEGGVWPLVQVLNFRYVPVRYQLLYVNVFCLIDSVFLSWFEQQKDVPWKQWITPFVHLKDEGNQKRV